MWVADDGSYGTGEIVLVEVDHWTAEQWADFEEQPDDLKIVYAYRQGRPQPIK